jgi:hypothetical protein
MTYDLYFLSPEQASAPAAFMQRLEAPMPPGTPEGERRMTAVVEALMRLDPSLQAFMPDFDEIARAEGITVEQARLTHNLVQLAPPEDRDNGILVNVHEGYVDFNVSYGYDADDADLVFSNMGSYAAAILAAGKYRLYDPQLERVADSFAEVRADGLKEYARVGEYMQGVMASIQEE